MKLLNKQSKDKGIDVFLLLLYTVKFFWQSEFFRHQCSMKQTGTDRRKGDGIFLVLLFIETKGSCYCLALSSLIPRPKSSFPSFAWFPGNWIGRERDLFRLLRWSMKSTQSVQLNNIWRCVRPKKPVIHILWKTNKYNHEWHPTYFDASSLKLLIQTQICALEGVGFNYKASTGKISTYWIQVVANKRCKCLENRISKVNIACSRLRDGSQNQISSSATPASLSSAVVQIEQGDWVRNSDTQMKIANILFQTFIIFL